MGGQLEKSTGLTGDTDGTDIGNVGDRLKVDTVIGKSSRRTYAAAVTNLAPALLATDIVTISGSAGATIYVTKVSVDGVATTGGNFVVQYIKRSAANTGGTSTTATNVPMDSNNSAATATVKTYTANPVALGTAVGTIRSNRFFVSSNTSSASVEDISLWGDIGQSPTLRGTGESLCLNLNSVTISTATLDIWIEWTEE